MMYRSKQEKGANSKGMSSKELTSWFYISLKMDRNIIFRKKEN